MSLAFAAGWAIDDSGNHRNQTGRRLADVGRVANGSECALDPGEMSGRPTGKRMVWRQRVQVGEY